MESTPQDDDAADGTLPQSSLPSVAVSLRRTLQRRRKRTLLLVSGALLAAWSLVRQQQSARVVREYAPSVSKPAPTNSTEFSELDEVLTTTKPTLLLHVGPRKTGTSFLQCALQNIPYALKADNYTLWESGPCSSLVVRPGLDARGFHSYRAFFETPRAKEPRLTAEFLSTLNQTLNSNAPNAILIWEDLNKLSSRDAAVLSKELHRHYSVKLVGTYRRFFDLLASEYNQLFKARRRQSPRTALWPGETAVVTLPNGRRKRVTGRALQPFALAHRREFSAFFHKAERETLHPLRQARNLYEQHHISGSNNSNSNSNNMTVFSMHDLDRRVAGDDLMQRIFCHVLPNTPHICAASQTDSIGNFTSPTGDNSFFSMNYDLLATHAYEQKLFGSQQHNSSQAATTVITRSEAFAQIQHRQEEILHLTEHDFALTCVSDATKQRILNVSLRLEQDLFTSSCNETRHREAFAEFDQKKKRYCSIDAAKVLETDSSWRDFFASL